METSQVIGHRVSTSGMLKYLGVSRSGYRSFLQRKPSQMQQRKENLKQDIRQIYEQSKQNYGAPKIAEELRKEGTCITRQIYERNGHPSSMGQALDRDDQRF